VRYFGSRATRMPRLETRQRASLYPSRTPKSTGLAKRLAFLSSRNISIPAGPEPDSEVDGLATLKARPRPERKKAPTIEGRGKLAERLEVEFGPFRSASR
jgi:hypothetical protein